MDHGDFQILGYRKDRLGARIVTLGNLLFLEDSFGVSVRYLWAATSEDHDMNVNDPDFPIFEGGFREKYVAQIAHDDLDALADLPELEDVRGTLSNDLFAQEIAAGKRFVCMNGFTPVFFSNERGPEHQERFKTSLSRIKWSSAITSALDIAIAKLAELPSEPLALHIRRGDVLDKEPWCHSNWTTKFAPDEFYTCLMDQPNTTTVLFSDTPAVVQRLAKNRPNAVTLDDLISTPDLSIMQRDVVEVLLMAHCKLVAAPALSAFSSSAIAIGGSDNLNLPDGLPTQIRNRAYDEVLDRVLAGPSNFHNDGDFAQSLGFAFRHSLNVGKHNELYRLIKTVMAQGHKFAFYSPIAMALAIACDAPGHAIKVAKAAEVDPHIWENDRMVCESLGHLAAHVDGDKKRATTNFLNLYFTRARANPAQDSLAHYFYQCEPRFQEMFQLDKVVVDALCGAARARTFLFPKGDDLFEGALNAALPLWVPAADWPELFEKKKLQQRIVIAPNFENKQFTIPNEIVAAERAFFRDDAPLPTDPESLKLLSVFAVALRLSGRYKRASLLSYHCRNTMPDHAIFSKRLAEHHLKVGLRDRAAKNLTDAASLLPNHPGITLARANMALDDGEFSIAANLLVQNASQPYLPINYFKAWEHAMRKLKSVEGALDVIREAERHFPTHPIFDKRWGKLLRADEEMEM